MTEVPFDYGSLDWSAHMTASAQRPIGDGLHLAEAISRTGKRLVEYWSDETIADVGRINVSESRIPDPDEAFDVDGNAIGRVHRTWGPVVRRILPPGRWQSTQLRIADMERWLRSHIRHPVSGALHPVGDLRSLRGRDKHDPITRANWQAAFEISPIGYDYRQTSISYLEAVVSFLIDMHASGQLAIRSRPLAGFDSTVGSDVWFGDLEHRMRIVAECSHVTDMGRQLLFVDEVQLEATLNAHGEERYVPYLPRDHPWFIDFRHDDQDDDADDGRNTPVGLTTIDEETCVTKHEDIERRVRWILRTLLIKENPTNWRLNDLLLIVEKHDDVEGETKILEEVVRAVREDWLDKDEFTFLSNKGQPSKNGRPTQMGSNFLKKMIAKSRFPVTPSPDD